MWIARTGWTASCLVSFAVSTALLGGDEPKSGEKPPSQPFVSDKGKFKVTFPTNAKLDERMVELPYGDEKLKLYIVGIETNTVTYLASYVDYPKNAFENRNRDDILDGVVKGQLDGMKGKEKTTKKIKVEEMNARELVFEIPPKKLHGKVRALLVGERLYQIIAYENIDKPVHVDDFLKSFKLIKDK